MQDVTFLLMLYVLVFPLMCFKTTRAMTTTKTTTPVAINDTKAAGSPLAPVVDIMYCKEQTYMIKPHPIYTTASLLRPLFIVPNKPCIRLERGEFELSIHDSAGGKKFSVLTSRKQVRKGFEIRQLFSLEMALNIHDKGFTF